ncbi:insulinase family protein [Candidatus Peregrinibacteria bacterium]|nr:insulinase family protein [Candidatus Peregrinibacteria bacterium]
MSKKIVLQNGLRVIVHPMSGVNSVTVLVLVGAGSRYENKNINGIAHFLEHMFFKGALRYPDAKSVSSAIDSVGGDFNAFTGKEYVGYYVKVSSQNVKLACDVLSDMLIHSKFDSHEIDKERGVILEEYNMYQDTPMYQVGWDFERLLFGDQPLGWDQVGTKELIETVTHEDFVDYKSRLYTPDNTVISIVGNIQEQEVLDLVGQYFTFEDNKKVYDWLPFSLNSDEGKVYLRSKKTEQAHIVLGFHGHPETHEDHYSLNVLSVLLGGNMSSRMFLAVREAQGLAYYIQTSTDDYADTGIISTRAGVQVKRIDEAILAITEEYKKVLSQIPEDEVRKAKDYLKGKLVLRLEDSEEYAHLLAKHELLHGIVKTPEEILQDIEKVQVADVMRTAQNLFRSSCLRLAAIGPFDDSKRFEKLLYF